LIFIDNESFSSPLICPWRGYGYDRASNRACTGSAQSGCHRCAPACVCSLFENIRDQLTAKVDPAAYETAVKSACAAEANALSQALIRYDVAMGTKRATALSNAERDVDDYRLTSVERYRDIMANP